MDVSGYIENTDVISRITFAHAVNSNVKNYYSTRTDWTNISPPNEEFPLTILRQEWDAAVPTDIDLSDPNGHVNHIDPVSGILERCRQFNTMRYCAYYQLKLYTGYQGSPVWFLETSAQGYAAFLPNPSAYWSFNVSADMDNDPNDPSYGYAFKDYGSPVNIHPGLSSTSAQILDFNLSGDLPINAGAGNTPFLPLTGVHEHPTLIYTTSGYNDFLNEIIEEIETLRSTLTTVGIMKYYCHNQCYVNCYGRCSHTWGSGGWFLDIFTFPAAALLGGGVLFDDLSEALQKPFIQDYPDIPPPPPLPPVS